MNADKSTKIAENLSLNFSYRFFYSITYTFLPSVGVNLGNGSWSGAMGALNEDVSFNACKLEIID